MTYPNIFEYYGSKFPYPLSGMASALLKKLKEGSICIDLDDLDAQESSHLKVTDFLKSIPQLKSSNLLSDDITASNTPFVLNGTRLYMQRYFGYELSIANRIKELIQDAQHSWQDRLIELMQHIDFLENFIWNQNQASHDLQTIAALLGFMNNFTIVTGGPGVGKTTSTKKILALLVKMNPNTRIALCAPTGKAAQRMKESLSGKALSDLPNDISEKISLYAEKASTIHSLLGSKNIQDHSPYFKHNKENPLQFDAIVIDESSMIDVALFAKIMDAIPKGSRVIMLGDKDQLASVEAASIFGDICLAGYPLNDFHRSVAESLNPLLQPKNQLPISQSNDTLLNRNIIELLHSHRFSSDKGIGKLSKAVIHADEDAINTYLNSTDDEVKIDTEMSDHIFRNFISGYKKYIEFLCINGYSQNNIKISLNLLNEYRVLVAVREGRDGLFAINKKIEYYLEKNISCHLKLKLKDDTIMELNGFNTNAEFYPFRPVMITQNNYSVSPILFNGDVGMVFPDENGLMKTWFEKDGDIVGYSCGLLSYVETNFAQTIHKSQGSEYDHVMIVLPKGTNNHVFTRELLYTAITRAKKQVTISSTMDTLKHTISQKIQRQSGIAVHLNRKTPNIKIQE